MSLPLGADSGQLRRWAFKAYEDHMTDAQRELLDGTGPPQPVPPRADIDAVVNKVLPESWEAVTTVTAGLVALPRDDANQVRALAKLVEATEAQNVDTATEAFGGHHA